MKKSKKSLSLLLALVFSIGCFSVIVANAEDTVLINAANFPDATFRSAVAEYYDENGDGILSLEERSCTYMSVSGMIDTETQEIKDLKGIEFFTNLKNLRCAGIGLRTLDVSSLSNLVSLTCSGNWLTSLDVFSNLQLEELKCSDNDLTSLNMPYSNTLKTLHCYANELTELEPFRLSNLQDLRCDQNHLTTLDLTANQNLVKLNCSNNHLTSLDLSVNTMLENVTDYMIGNQSISLVAHLEGQHIVIPFENSGLTHDNYSSCSLDGYDEGTYFDLTSFVVDDVKAIENGIDYECSTMLAGSENMSVHVNVERGNICQADFYSDDTLSTRVGWYLLEKGGTAVAPSAPTAPLCKAFDGWSESLENIMEDKTFYALWADNHAYVVTAFDGVYATLTCADCSNAETRVKFIDSVNSKQGDGNYYPALDVHADGTINAKDFAKLSKSFG